MSIDGISIIVNGNIISCEEEIHDLITHNKYLDVSFILIQAKNSSSFDTGEIAKFLIGVKSLFEDENKSYSNANIQEKAEIINSIYQQSSHFINRNPICKMYYVTTGKWVDDQNIKNTVQSLIKNIDDLNIMEKGKVEFIPIDSDKLRTLYRQSDTRITREIQLQEYIPLPEIKGVQQAHIGIIHAEEYIKLITDESKNIIKGLFYDNVRDYQGENNDVNKEIDTTIKLRDKHDSFVLFNNGVTIVAEQFNLIGKGKVSITDYQIVNGCQTSYVIFNNVNNISKDLLIPIKIITLTRESEIKNEIIKSTNRQTPVTIEELEALTEFQKKLEDFYKTLSKDDKCLFYERRAKQYHGEHEVKKNRIVDIQLQMKCFSSMFLDQAHNSGRYKAKLFSEIKNKIFKNSHHPLGYYISAYSFFLLNNLFSKGEIDSKYKPFKFHLLNIFRILSVGFKCPDLSSNEFLKCCQTIEKNLKDEVITKQLFLESVAYIDQVVVKIYNKDYSRSNAKTSSFSTHLTKLLSSKVKPPIS